MSTISPANAVLKLTGTAVLLNIKHKSKAPTLKDWPKLTLADMTPDYLTGLKGNIGVSLGTASDGLYTIDCDTDEAFCEMLDHNPLLKETLHSHAVRGGNFWVRVKEGASKSGKLKTLKGEPVGEWRSDGNQTVIHGKHPDGKDYSNNGKPVATIEFSELKWPTNWKLPWEKDTKPKEPKSKDSLVYKAPRDLVRGIKSMLDSIPTRPDRDTWLKVSAAVRNGLGDTEIAIEILKAWSPEEEEGEYAKLLESPLSEIGIGTLVFHAAEYGFEGFVRLFFYDGRGFFMESSTGDFIHLNGESAVRQHLEQLGVPRKHTSGILCSIRENQQVDLVSEVAGKKRGLHEFQGSRILVTKGPSIIKPSPGTDTFIEEFFSGLLDDPAHPEQLPTFLDWLAHTRAAVIRGIRAQTPVMVLAGDRCHGKSLAIEIVNRSLGGRGAQAYRYFSGDTNFNADLIRAELLTIDDAAASRDRRSRLELAQNIKGNFFSPSMRVEGKGANAVNCAPVHALIFAVNSDAEHLRVLPVLDSSMEDKISLLITRAANLGDLAGKNSAISERMGKALPSFLDGLEKRDLSTSYDSGGRLKCFWHPKLIEELADLSDENRLLSLIRDNVSKNYFSDHPISWEGEAISLETKLTGEYSSTQTQARMLLKYPNTCGTLLARLASEKGTGVEKAGLSPGTRVQRYKINTSNAGMRG